MTSRLRLQLGHQHSNGGDAGRSEDDGKKSKKFKKAKKLDSLQSCVLHHPFNYKIQIVLPSLTAKALLESKFLENLRGVQDGKEKPWCYYLVSWNLLVFCDPLFLQQFVSQNGVIATSYMTKIDSSECVVSLLESGVLMLNTDIDTYQQLGLTGKKSKIAPTRYVVEVNLKDPKFRPGEKYYERVKWCFSHTLSKEMEFIVCFLNQNGCPVSMSDVITITTTNEKKGDERKFFTQPSLVSNIKRIPLIPSIEHTENFTIPRFDVTQLHHDNTKTEELREYWSEAFEWLGLLLCNCLSEYSELRELSTMQLNEAVSTFSASCCIIKLTGILPPSMIWHIINDLKSSFSIDGEKLPWISISVHGFVDSPISWDSFEHGFNLTGENDYSVLLFPKNGYAVQRAICDNDEDLPIGKNV